MTGTFMPDVSYYQVKVDSSFNLPFLECRIADGTFIDPNWAANAAYCRNAIAQGKMVGFVGYYVYELLDVNSQFLTIQKTVGPVIPQMAIMIDLERWGGRISGDHSDQINQLCGLIAAWLGSWSRVIVYGNVGDLNNIFPRPDSRLRFIVGSYGSQPTYRNMLGWQYSDGNVKWSVPAGWPRTAAPFGPCDMNYFALDPISLARTLGLMAAPQEDEDMYVTMIAGAGYYLPNMEHKKAMDSPTEYNEAVAAGAHVLTLTAAEIADIPFVGQPTNGETAIVSALNGLATTIGNDINSLATNIDGVLGKLPTIPAQTASEPSTPVVAPKRVLFGRPESGPRAYLPVGDNAARRWVSGTEAATWPEGYSITSLQDNDPFWALPSLTQNAEDLAAAVAAAATPSTGAHAL